MILSTKTSFFHCGSKVCRQEQDPNTKYNTPNPYTWKTNYGSFLVNTFQITIPKTCKCIPWWKVFLYFSPISFDRFSFFHPLNSMNGGIRHPYWSLSLVMGLPKLGSLLPFSIFLRNLSIKVIDQWFWEFLLGINNRYGEYWSSTVQNVLSFLTTFTRTIYIFVLQCFSQTPAIDMHLLLTYSLRVIFSKCHQHIG